MVANVNITNNAGKDMSGVKKLSAVSPKQLFANKMQDGMGMHANASQATLTSITFANNVLLDTDLMDQTV